MNHLKTGDKSQPGFFFSIIWSLFKKTGGIYLVLNLKISNDIVVENCAFYFIQNKYVQWQ